MRGSERHSVARRSLFFEYFSSGRTCSLLWTTAKKRKPQLELLHKQNWIEVLQLSGRENLQQMAKIRTAECPNPVNRYSPPPQLQLVSLQQCRSLHLLRLSQIRFLPYLFSWFFFASAAKRIVKKLV